MNEIMEAGKNKLPWAKVTPSSIYAFSYTSGTTGTPKGAMISHRNIVSVFSGINERFEFNDNDSYINYLPMAHIMERAVINAFMHFNVTIYFFSGDILKLKEDLAIFKPTIFLSVPRIYNKFYDSIKAGIEAKSPIIQKLA